MNFFYRTVFTLILFIALQAHAAEVSRKINWDDLLPKVLPLEHPFHQLTMQQLLDLEFLVNIDKRKKKGKISNVHAIFEKGMEVQHELTRQGLNVTQLIATYNGWEREIAKRNKMTNIEFRGQIVSIPGYALPLEHRDMGVKEFLLVPYVGACIHVPPPPPNQTVYVSLKEAYTIKDLYEPVWITGRLSIKATNQSLSLIDGSADVETAYTLDGIMVRPYKDY